MLITIEGDKYAFEPNLDGLDGDTRTLEWIRMLAREES